MIGRNEEYDITGMTGRITKPKTRRGRMRFIKGTLQSARIPLTWFFILMLLVDFRLRAFQAETPKAPPQNQATAVVRANRNRLFNALAPRASSSGAPIVAVVTSATVAVMPEMPAAESDLIVVGTVESVESFLTENRGAVYTEFTIRLSEVISNNTGLKFEPGNSDESSLGARLSVLTPGGRMKGPDGQGLIHEVKGIGEPLSKDRKYLLFLRTRRSAQCGLVVKAWDLTDGKAKPLSLEDWNRANQKISLYSGLPEAQFLDIARKQIAEQKPLD
jgi:hypothetical protein